MYALGTRVNYVTSVMYALGPRENYVTSAMYALEPVKVTSLPRCMP